MTFKRWIITIGLSEGSAKNYSGAILGSISNWAKDAGLIDSSLIEISDLTEFEKLSIRIQRLPIFQERNATGNKMYSNALNKYSEYLKEASNELAKDLEEIIRDNSYSETDKIALVKYRIGQGAFRDNLLSYWKGCAVTGYKKHSMLIASHIKPWRDSNNQERLDKYNGLLLTPNLDKAFDTGFISFAGNGKILISEVLKSPGILGIEDSMKINFEKSHQQYLEYHRNMVFFNL
ncbi:MAG: HNH endonuclease [Candidatus Paceibacterota bacterium]